MAFFCIFRLIFYMDINKLHEIFLTHPVICTDTRKIEKDCIFFALKGSNFDGNTFALDAIKEGAAFSIVDNTNFSNHKNCILVDNVLLTLQQLANFHRKYLKIPVLAITGTNGKTTTKELINIVLSVKYKVKATKGNLNNHIGVPLTLLSFNKNTELGIVEMGANHIGEIENLCRIAEPDFGIITNIGKAHIEGFGSYEGIIKTKTELYRYLNNHSGKIFCNVNNSVLYEQSLNFKDSTAYFGDNNSKIEAKIIKNNPFLIIKVIDDKEEKPLKTNLIGAYNLENILNAIAIGKYFGISITDSIYKIAEYSPDNMRSQLIKTERNTLIVDAYNANPTSMKLAIENFSNLKFKNKIMILGDMLELGGSQDNEHKHICDLFMKLNLKNTILVGSIFNNTCHIKSVRKFVDIYHLINSGILNDFSGFYILIKGSRGIALEKAINYL